MAGGKSWVDVIFDRQSQVSAGYADFSQTADSTVIQNTTVETAFSVSRSLPANALRAGSCVRVKALIRVVNANGTDTLTIRGRLGTLDIVVSSAVDVAANDTIWVEYWVKTRAAPGASVDVVGAGAIIFSTGSEGTLSTASMLPDAQTLNTAGPLVVDITAQWSVANANNQVKMDDFNVYVDHPSAP